MSELHFPNVQSHRTITNYILFYLYVWTLFISEQFNQIQNIWYTLYKSTWNCTGCFSKTECGLVVRSSISAFDDVEPRQLSDDHQQKVLLHLSHQSSLTTDKNKSEAAVVLAGSSVNLACQTDLHIVSKANKSCLWIQHSGARAEGGVETERTVVGETDLLDMAGGLTMNTCQLKLSNVTVDEHGGVWQCKVLLDKAPGRLGTVKEVVGRRMSFYVLCECSIRTNIMTRVIVDLLNPKLKFTCPH